MSWILTAMGNEIDLACPAPTRIVLVDVSHALAQINSFTGHARRPYSVAEHSLLVLEIVQRLMHVDVHGQFAALMHDAHEAYVGDMATPTKRLAGADWALLEGRMERALRSAWGLHNAAHLWRDQIKTADLIALATEREQLLPNVGAPWDVLLQVKPVDWVDLMAPERLAMTWADWRDRFKDEADGLDFARNDQVLNRSAAR